MLLFVPKDIEARRVMGKVTIKELAESFPDRTTLSSGSGRGLSIKNCSHPSLPVLKCKTKHHRYHRRGPYWGQKPGLVALKRKGGKGLGNLLSDLEDIVPGQPSHWM